MIEMSFPLPKRLLQKEMGIAFLVGIPTSNPSSGGGYVHVSQVALRLLKHGHRLFTNLKNESDRFVKLAGREFLDRRREIELFYIRIHGSATNDGLTLLRQLNPHAPCIWEVNSPLEELRTLGIPEEKLRKLNKRRRRLARLVDAAICVSDEMAEYARDELGIQKTYVIPNGSDPELFTPEKRDSSIYGTSKYKVLYSGSFKYKWQNIETVQRLVERFKEKGCDDILLIATAEGDSSDNLLYLGHVPYGEMPRYMASADVGLCLYENFDFYKKFYGSPTKFYDYMASGLPVVGSGLGQIKHVIEASRSGLLTDNSVDDLVEKILFLKNNPGLAAEMGSRGRKAVLDTYNWENVVLWTEDILWGAVREHAAANADVVRSMIYRSMKLARLAGKAVLRRDNRN